MALSEAESKVLDPKAHLGASSLHEIGASGDFDDSASRNHLVDTSHNTVTQSVNALAHQVNSSNNDLEQHSAPVNGIHVSPNALGDTQSSIDPETQAPALDTPASTQPNSFAIKDPHPDQTLISSENALDSLNSVGAPPVIQQPLSDARHSLPSETTDDPSSGAQVTDHQDQSVAQTQQELPEKSLPSPAPEPVETSEKMSEQALPPKQNEERPQIDSTETQPPPTAQSNDTPLPDPISESPIVPPQSSSADQSKNHADTAEPAVMANGQFPAPEGHDQDHAMEDVNQPTKIGRAREGDDDLDEPAAKRSRTDEDGLKEDFKVPDRPQIDTSVAADAQSATSQSSPMTKPRKKHLQKAIANIKRNQAARPFLIPVDAEALNIPNYYTVITRPMDLKTIEDKLRADEYTTTEAMRADFEQILQNTKIFNGELHPVTLNAMTTREKFEQAIATLPSADVQDPVPAKKKAIADPAAIRVPPPRRESRSSLPGSAKSPASAVSPQTFALGPEGVPLIRRDSTIDGRPKREIHRPAPKDLPYTNQKPKKKKYVLELKFCDRVLKELANPKYKDIYDPFKVPVDPVALNIPSYHSVVKKPMDFGTMRTKLNIGQYENAKEFELDARQVFKNCYSFNPENDPVNRLGKALEGVFNYEWSQKQQWLDENAPDSGQRSPATSDDEESEGDEEEEEEDDSQMEIVSKLQKQIAEMSKQVEMITSGAKKKTPPTATKKAAKASKPAKKENKKAAPAPAKAEKKATSKNSKKAAAPYVTYEQKQDISTRINSLSESKMTQALSIIRSNMPNLQGIQEDELELDIDELSNEVLYKLLQFVRKHAPRDDDSPLPAPVSSSSAAPSRKKNKPMSKTEQEARIRQVQDKLKAFDKGGAGGISPNDVQQSIEDQSDEDEEDSESEEE